MAKITSSDKIYVAGHRGLVGSAIVKKLAERGYKNIVARSRDELNLLDQKAVSDFFQKEKPDGVFVAAAKVGGILANNTYRADFIFENLQIQNNIIWSAHRADCQRLVFLGSSCIYPKHAEQPMKESALLTGPLEPTNRPYAIAKIAGLELVQSLRKQYKRDYFSVMPTNLYGPGDNFDLENSHVLPALIRKFHEAKIAQKDQVVVWGTGTPKREFMYSEDCAAAMIQLAEQLPEDFFETLDSDTQGFSHINVGSGDEVSIKELATMVKEVVGFAGELVFDTSKPDGTPRKLLDLSLLRQAGVGSGGGFRSYLKRTYEWYLTHDKR